MSYGRNDDDEDDSLTLQDYCGGFCTGPYLVQAVDHHFQVFVLVLDAQLQRAHLDLQSSTQRLQGGRAALQSWQDEHHVLHHVDCFLTLVEQ